MAVARSLAITGAPFKIAVATAIGTVFGSLGAFLGRWRLLVVRA